MTLTIAELPVRERPVIELLDLQHDREQVNRDYAGYGWARAGRVWLVDRDGPRAVDDALVLAVHSADDGEPLVDDIELEFELPPEVARRAGEPSVLVLLSQFLAVWLPRLPHEPAAIVLVCCNPHQARLRPVGDRPIHYALGDVESWLELADRAPRIRLAAPIWCTLGSP